jgi:hypothetical protein
VEPGTCPAAGGIGIHGIQTGGAVLSAAGPCVGDAGDFNSWDVQVDCLGGAVLIEQSRFLGNPCTASLLVNASGPSVLIQQNELSGSHGTELMLQAVDGGEVRRNFMHGPCCDGQLGNESVQTFGFHASGCSNVWVHHNLVVRAGQYGIGAVDPGNAIPNDAINLSDNTIVGDECGLRFNAVTGQAHSNLVSGGACAQSGCNNTCGVPCGVDIINLEGGAGETVSVGFDLYDFSGPAQAYCLQSGMTFTIQDAGPDLFVSPAFVNAAQGDYHLTPISPAIDEGDPATPPGVDFDGNPEPVPGRPGDPARADIGCYEFQLDAGDGGGADAGASTDAGPSPDGGALPVAVIAQAQQTVDAGAPVQLSGTQSSATPGATLISFQWTETQGPTGVQLSSATTQSFSASVPGTYGFQLVVQDSTGASSAPASATVVVTGQIASPSMKNACGCGAEGGEPALALFALFAALTGTRRAGRKLG